MNRVAIVGCGNVGMAYAYSLVNKGCGVNEIVLIDINKEKIRGQVLDLQHAIYNSNNDIKIVAGEYADCAEVDIVCITAGPGQGGMKNSRLDDLFKANDILKDIIPEIRKSGFNGIYLMASNPLDVMTYLAWKHSGQNPNKIIGSGTLLDTARLKYILSEKYNKSINEIEGYVLGEHGNSQLIKWDIVNLDVPDEDKKEIEGKVRNAAFEVVKYQGYTCYGIGTALAKITQAILLDEEVILPISTYIEELDVFISTPSLIGRVGVKHNMLMNLSKEQKAKFTNSVNIIKSALKEINLD